MKFKPIKTFSPTDIFVNQIKTAVLTGEYQIGDKLPSERELAKELQVSINVVNAGLKKLARLHFIKIKSCHGAYIADFRTEGNLATLNEIINFYDGHYPRSLVKSFLEVRQTIEADMIHSTCQKATKKDFDKMNQVLRSMQLRINNEMPKLTFIFIHRISLASKNQVYPLLINNFKSVYLTLGKWLCREMGAKQILKRNEKLFHLLVNKQETEAITYNNQSIKQVYQILTKVD